MRSSRFSWMSRCFQLAKGWRRQWRSEWGANAETDRIIDFLSTWGDWSELLGHKARVSELTLGCTSTSLSSESCKLASAGDSTRPQGEAAYLERVPLVVV